MMENNDLEKIRQVVEEFLGKMTLIFLSVEVVLIPASDSTGKESININITMPDPQMLIGQQGQTLFELSRLLRIMLNKKLRTLRPPSTLLRAGGSGQEDFYVNLDINEYKKKKLEYLKDVALQAAAEVIATGEKKILPPMPAYERRIIHTELAGRQDVATESCGDGLERSVVVVVRQ